MNRNYKKEYLWEKEKYDILKVKLDKELGQKLRNKLKQENKTITNWVTDNAKKYIKSKE